MNIVTGFMEFVTLVMVMPIMLYSFMFLLHLVFRMFISRTI